MHSLSHASYLAYKRGEARNELKNLESHVQKLESQLNSMELDMKMPGQENPAARQELQKDKNENTTMEKEQKEGDFSIDDVGMENDQLKVDAEQKEGDVCMKEKDQLAADESNQENVDVGMDDNE